MFLKYFTIVILLVITLPNLMGQEIDLRDLPEVEDYMVVLTNPDADTIIIALHGGPTDELYEGSFHYFEEISTYSVVEVMKYEMLEPILYKEEYTIEEGRAANDTTAALIQKVVEHYNELDKTVVIIGHSWGAIVMGEYLDDYGVDHVHRIIPMEGRINMQLEFVDLLLDGYLATFADDGTTILLTNEQGAFPVGLMVLGAAAFENRWADSLAHLDLSKMMYTYAENDNNTGALLPEETLFLDETGARTLFIPDAWHGAVFEDMYLAQIVEFIREDNMTSVADDNHEYAKLELFPSLAHTNIQINNDKKGELYVFDMMGKTIYQNEISSGLNTLDVSNFVSAQYVALFKNADNEISSARFSVVK